MNSKDSLGDRMKRYERVSQTTLTPRMPVCIRVDGKAFHTYTKNAQKPFDPIIMNSMIYAAKETAKTMQGFKLAYVQSDEATFLITDTDKLNTQGWFGYEHSKIVSITASTFTAYFNQIIKLCTIDMFDHLAMFDARAFNIPINDAPNTFIWRQQDWLRNSVQMLAHAHFSHKELNGKKIPDMHEMLYTKGVNWADCSPREKNGTFIDCEYDELSLSLSYDEIYKIITGDNDE